MKTFLIQIRAYGYHARFEMKSQDEDKAFEDALVDKLGQKDIVWEKDGFTSKSKLWLTYEEVINDTRPIQTKKVLGVEVATGASR